MRKASSRKMGLPGNSQIFHYMSQVFLAFIFTTMLLMMYLDKLHHESEMHRNIEKAKEEVLEEMRLERLRELQRTIFTSIERPPDQTYNINVSLSESISLERDVPESRPLLCMKKKYDISKFPTITVIIPFYNEALSMLLRTVHSILNRTPAQLLRQIILVNDNSPNQDLNEPLEKYVRLLPRKVRLIKTNKREGLIRARLLGASMATGEVLMFQDAHTECNVGWAEPLLDEIVKNPKTVIQPSVDQIEQWTLQYIPGMGVVPRGGFSWDLRYVWMEMPEHEKKRLNFRHEYVAHRTGTLVGCAMAIRKDYFFSIGGFDDDMNIWGGENIELAFRVWMCGGQVLNHPCSRVAHTFKPFAYSFDGDREKIVQKNQMRIAHLWMDDWKKFFLAATYSWPTKHTVLSGAEKASLEKRQILKENLKCKSFQWYMENITPEIPTPPLDAVYYGEVTNLKTDACLAVKPDGYVVMTYYCFFHRILPQNIFYIDQHGRLLYRNRCILVEESTWLLKLGGCPNNEIPPQKWDTTLHSEVEGIIHVTLRDSTGVEKKLCPTQVTNINPVHHREQMPQMLECEENNWFQKWRWTYKFNYNYDWDNPD